MGLRDRIAALERRVAGGDMLVVLVTGGLPDGEGPEAAGAGENRWAQEPGEDEASFKVRVVAEARAKGVVGYVWIGGLPA